jgi:leader peptidase (prepilin peptidase)/N-methyltransferase
MSWTPLRDRAQFSNSLGSMRKQPVHGDVEMAVTGRGMARPALQGLTEYAIFFALGSAATIASIFAAPGVPGLFGSALGILMLAIAITDARSFMIPNWLVIAAFAIALAETSARGLESILENVAIAAMRGIILALAFYALRELYWLLRHRTGIGLGDVKLAAAAGAWLDWTFIPVAIEIAAFAALIGYTASQLVSHRPLSAATKVPFGLFFAPAIWFCWLLNAILG